MRRRLYTWTEGHAPRLVERQAPKKLSDRSDNRRGAHVVGLDLSLRATAACALPLDWDYDLAKVRMLRANTIQLSRGASALQRAERIAQIAHDVVVFCLNVKATCVMLEDYAFAQSMANARETAELGGVVKHEILQALHFAAEPIVASQARKLLLQQLPGRKKGVKQPPGFLKEWVVRNVKRLGPVATTWTDDECDAFVVANAALERAGTVPLSFPGI